jgi:predicted TIM-barrel fold metal-dependent hydrolase
MSELDFPAFDADNHYYEAEDAFTRHLDPKMAKRCVQWAEVGGRRYHLVGEKVSHAVVNVTFDPIAMAGAMYEYFRGNPDELMPADFLKEREPIPAYYRDRDARLALMDTQGLERVWMFPTVGVLYEELLKNDIPALCHTFSAFNRWAEEDWGCNYQDRLYAAPYITLADLDAAITEIEWALEHDARVVCMRPAAPTTVHGPMSPFDKYFDPFWARVNEAGIVVVAHAGDSGYTTHGYADRSFAAFGDTGGSRPSISGFRLERAAHDFFVTSVFDKLFVRHPNVRLASVENGSAWVAKAFKRIESTRKKAPHYFKGNDPLEHFKTNIWINPFWEDDPYEAVELMGSDRIIFGSDWPHVEGMPQPLDYAKEVKELDDADLRKVMYSNAVELSTPRPA